MFPLSIPLPCACNNATDGPTAHRCTSSFLIPRSRAHSCLALLNQLFREFKTEPHSPTSRDNLHRQRHAPPSSATLDTELRRTLPSNPSLLSLRSIPPHTSRHRIPPPAPSYHAGQAHHVGPRRPGANQRRPLPNLNLSHHDPNGRTTHRVPATTPTRSHHHSTTATTTPTTIRTTQPPPLHHGPPPPRRPHHRTPPHRPRRHSLRTTRPPPPPRLRLPPHLSRAH